MRVYNGRKLSNPASGCKGLPCSESCTQYHNYRSGWSVKYILSPNSLNWLIHEVGRIWRVHRAAGLLFNKGVSRRYKTAIYALWVKRTHRLVNEITFILTIISVESGAIYSVYMVLILGTERVQIILVSVSPPPIRRYIWHHYWTGSSE